MDSQTDNMVEKPAESDPNRSVVNVDRIWASLGRFGRFQFRQLIVCLISIWSCGFHMLSIVFIGYRPPFQCANITNLGNSSSNSWHEYKKCHVKTYNNDSGVLTVAESGCTNGWTFNDGEPFSSERSFVSEWELVCERQELTELSQTLLMIGQALGAFLFTSLADRYGRKPIHIFCHIMVFAVSLSTAFVPNYPAFAALRFALGFVQQGTGLTVAILMLELFPKECRGLMEVLGLLFWTTGIAIVTPIAFLVHQRSWRYLQVILACLSGWSLIEWWLVDESLRWLIANGKVERAKAVIRKACQINKKDYETVCAAGNFHQFAEAAEKSNHNDQAIELQTVTQFTDQKNGVTGDGKPLIVTETDVKPTGNRVVRYGLCDLIRSRRIFLVSLIMWFAWTTNSLTYYGIMLISSSLAGNRFLNFFLGSVVEYPAAFLELVMINRFGRKLTTIFFHAACCLSLVIATVLTTMSDGNVAMVTGSTIFTLVGKFAITGSFSTIFLYTPELYPTNLRNLGIGLSSAAARAGGMMAPFSRNLADLVSWGPGLVFGIMTAIVCVLTLFVPETNRKELPQTIEECEQWYKENQLKLPSSRRRRGAAPTCTVSS